VDEFISSLRRFGEQVGTRFLVFIVTTGLACVGVYVVARVVVPALASALTAFVTSPGVIVLAWLIWILRRRKGTH